MKVKTSELTGPALRWAVAQIEKVRLTGAGFQYLRKTYGDECVRLGHGGAYSPDTNWSQGGPIIERRRVLFHGEGDGNAYNAWIVEPYSRAGGPTHLVAAMRCCAASELGDEVDVPEELL